MRSLHSEATLTASIQAAWSEAEGKRKVRFWAALSVTGCRCTVLPVAHGASPGSPAAAPALSGPRPVCTCRRNQWRQQHVHVSRTMMSPSHPLHFCTCPCRPS